MIAGERQDQHRKQQRGRQIHAKQQAASDQKYDGEGDGILAEQGVVPAIPIQPVDTHADDKLREALRQPYAVGHRPQPKPRGGQGNPAEDRGRRHHRDARDE